MAKSGKQWPASRMQRGLRRFGYGIKFFLILIIGSAFQNDSFSEKGIYYDAFTRFVKSRRIKTLYVEEDVRIGLKEKFNNINIVEVNNENVLQYIVDTNWRINVLIVAPVDTIDGKLQVKFQVCNVESFNNLPYYSIQKVYLYYYAYNQKKKRFLYKGMRVVDCEI